jgi:hypothetical protein
MDSIKSKEKLRISYLNRNISRFIFIKLFIFLIFSFLMKITKSLEIFNFKDYYENKILDIPIKSMHFCQWEFINSLKITSPSENQNIINRLIFYDADNDLSMKYILQLFKDKKLNESSIYEFCSKLNYCGLMHVIK